MTNPRPKVTVVGDIILDRYLIGDVTRLNPEMPGVVIDVQREELRLGGASAVAMIATGMGADVTLAGVVGRDELGRRFSELVTEVGIVTHLYEGDRPTTWKQRILARGQLRPDRCDREVKTPISDDTASFLAQVPISNALLIQDYGKGVCTPKLLKSLIQKAQGVPVLVDPARGRRWSTYTCATLIKANWLEATEAAGTSELPPKNLAERLSLQHDCHVVITLGDHGLVCAERGGKTWQVPAMRARVRDVCGAGDTVLAVIGTTLAAGGTLREACRLAVAAAAAQIEQFGVATFDGLNEASDCSIAYHHPQHLPSERRPAPS